MDVLLDINIWRAASNPTGRINDGNEKVDAYPHCDQPARIGLCQLRVRRFV
jgi:hypothetical protein